MSAQIQGPHVRRRRHADRFRARDDRCISARPCREARRGVGDEAILDAYRHARAAAGVGLVSRRSRAASIGEMARELKLSATAAVAERFPELVKQWPAFADLAAALKRLRARYRLVAMTNARRWALAHMAQTLGEPFDDMVTVDDVRFEKPDPQFFAFARGRLSASGYVLEDILHVAQSQHHDIGVARKLGYTVCWIERRKGLKGFGGTKEAPITKPDYHFANAGRAGRRRRRGRTGMTREC